MKLLKLICLLYFLSITACASARIDDDNINACGASIVGSGEVRDLSLEDIYRSVLPHDMAGIVESSVIDTESYLKRSALLGKERVRVAGDYFYGRQIKGVVAYCKTKGVRNYSNYEASVFIESLYAKVVAVSGLRGRASELVESQLPSAISPNLTARVAFVEISVFCRADDMPELNSVLLSVGMRCVGRN